MRLTKIQKERIELFEKRKQFAYDTLIKARELKIALRINPKKGNYGWWVQDE